VLPSDAEYQADLTERLSEQALLATHDSISFDALRGGEDTYGRPVGGFLFPDEAPKALFTLVNIGIESYTGDSWTIDGGFRTTGHVLVTDQRLVGVFPNRPEPQLVEIALEDVTTVDAFSGLLNSGLQVTLADGFSYRLALKNIDSDTLQNEVELVERLSNKRDSKASRAKKLLNDLDAVVADGENMESVLRDMADRFAEHSEATRFDHAVAEAESFDEFLTALYESSVTSKPSQEHSETATEITTLSRSGFRLDTLKDDLAYTLQNADPAEVALYSVGLGAGLSALAVAAPFSTTAGLIMLATGGAATGAYASTHPESLAARIDPIALAVATKARGRQWNNAAVAGGADIGAILGTLEYLGEDVATDAYAHWVAQADFDSIIRGAEAALRAAEAAPDEHDERAVTALGGGVGLLYGYLDVAETDVDIKELLDDDLYGLLEE
jgi:hypothetical protein